MGKAKSIIKGTFFVISIGEKYDYRTYGFFRALKDINLEEIEAEFNGIMEKPENVFLKKARTAYLKKFPYAVLMKTSLWDLWIIYIKMTDNRLGFGKKLIWEK